MSASKLITLITGANQGLGYYAAAHLSLTNDHHVLLGSRSLSKAVSAIEALKSDSTVASNPSNISPIEIDVCSDESVSAAADSIRTHYGRLDVLINNAGISRAAGVHSDIEPNADGSGPSLREQYRQVYDTNVFGCVIVVDTMLPLLRKSTLPGGKRIGFTGSGTACLEVALTSEGSLNGRNYRMYRSTKTALNMLVVSYACELGDEGFIVAAGNPGYCGTNLNLNKGFKDPREGAKVVVMTVTEAKEKCHGRLVDETGILQW